MKRDSSLHNCLGLQHTAQLELEKHLPCPARCSEATIAAGRVQGCLLDLSKKGIFSFVVLTTKTCQPNKTN
jgi:hypothetical protein